jgi:hypothetical protein
MVASGMLDAGIDKYSIHFDFLAPMGLGPDCRTCDGRRRFEGGAKNLARKKSFGKAIEAMIEIRIDVRTQRGNTQRQVSSKRRNSTPTASPAGTEYGMPVSHK